MEEIVIPIFAITVCLLILPWMLFNFIAKMKQMSSMTVEDENLLDEMHMIARRLDERMNNIERIIEADRPTAQVTHLHHKSIGKDL